MGKVITICGIDTDVGKSVATGLLAAFLRTKGERVITQKPVQTGCEKRAEDIIVHRRLMSESWNKFDERGLTCSYCLPFPASPHLAAKLADEIIEVPVINQATSDLLKEHDRVIIEGAGGLLVPIQEDLLWADYIADNNYPLVLVTSPRLGSINHTLLSLEAIKSRNINLLGLVYNLYGNHPIEIVKDTMSLFKQKLSVYGWQDRVVIMPDIKETRNINWGVLID